MMVTQCHIARGAANEGLSINVGEALFVNVGVSLPLNANVGASVVTTDGVTLVGGFVSSTLMVGTKVGIRVGKADGAGLGLGVATLLSIEALVQ